MTDYRTMYECAAEFARSLILEANSKDEEIRRLEAEIRELQEQAEELRFNPNHDQKNGRFISGNGVDISTNGGIIKNKNVIDRGMANGLRKSQLIPLSEGDKEYIRGEITAIEADSSVFVFRDGRGSGYNEKHDIVYISSNIFPARDNSLHPRDLMSVRAALAHEYYGHRAFRGTKVKQGAWNDEFRASYFAAKNAPNLSVDDRRYLILDCKERAKDAGITVKDNAFMKGILYGFNE